MKFLSLLAAAVAILPSLTSAAAIRQDNPAAIKQEKRLATPANDPFYQPPADFAATKPGTVLRERPIIASFFGLIPAPVDARQLLYRTTATDGSAIATVATIFRPALARPDRVISFSTAYDSAGTICQPSYTYHLFAPQNDFVTASEFLIIQAYLLSGYTVVSADYEGPEAAFTAGRLSGMGILDSMRAFIQYAPKLFLSDKPSIVGVGYSGGALAAGWAAAIQPTYAPELDFKGWSIGGTPTNLTSVLEFVDGTAFSGFIPGSIAGLLKPTAYAAQIKPVFDQIATPYGRGVFKDGGEKCINQNLISFANQSLLDTKVQTLGPDLLFEPHVAKVLKETTLGLNSQERPTPPVRMYHAPQDEIIPYYNAALLSQQWCEQGASVHFTNYTAGGHGTTEIVALPQTIKFVHDAFEGKVDSGCTSNAVMDNKLDPLALGLGLEPILAELVNRLLKASPFDLRSA